MWILGLKGLNRVGLGVLDRWSHMEVRFKLLVVTFESLNRIMCYYHSKETSSLALFKGTICLKAFYEKSRGFFGF